MTVRNLWLCSLVLMFVGAGSFGQVATESRPIPAQAKAATALPKGHLIIIGGGTTTDDMTKKAMTLAAKKSPRVVVVPQASGRDDAGQKSTVMWKDLGAEAEILDGESKEKAMSTLKAADIIWMPGGLQTRLMEFFEKQGLIATLRQKFEDGAVIGGTSAGAAVMSEVMITGDFDGEGLTAKTTETVKGLGLVQAMIVDQHFHKRRRFNRLLSAVLDQPGLVGFGIDEATAIVVSGRSLEVIGRSSVIVVDARRATLFEKQKGEPLAAEGVVVHVWPTGKKIELDFNPFAKPVVPKR